MKKIFTSVLLFSAFLLVTGCGKKEQLLKCSINADEAIFEFDSKFIDGGYDSGTFKYEMDLSNYSEAEIEKAKSTDLCSTLAETYKFNKDDCNQEIVNKKLVISSPVDIYEYIAKGLNHDSVVKYNIDDTKDILEGAGYTCTEK